MNQSQRSEYDQLTPDQENAIHLEVKNHLQSHLQDYRYVESQLPVAAELADYEAISPGMAEHFIQLYAAARSREEMRADHLLKTTERRRTIALLFAFTLAILAGFGGIDAFADGDAARGLTFTGGSLSTFVLAFLKATQPFPTSTPLKPDRKQRTHIL